MSIHPTTILRHQGLLTTALGRLVPLLAAPDLVELIVTPTGEVWTEQQGGALAPTGIQWSAAQVEYLIATIAGLSNLVCTPTHPHLSAILPGSGVRVEAAIPPATAAPELTMRRPAPRVYALDEYIPDVMTAWQAQVLQAAVHARRNIVLAGATGTGKSTLLNTCLTLMPGERLVTIEDTQEAFTTSPLWAPLYTTPGQPMAALLQRALRKRPDRIIVGEVRGVEAVDLLDSWNTGHSGLTTIHANTPAQALTRFEGCARAVSSSHPQPLPLDVARPLIAQNVHLIVCLQRTSRGRRVSALARVHGLEGNGYNLTLIEEDDHVSMES